MIRSAVAKEYGTFFHLAREHQVIFYYVGYFSQNIVAAMAEAVKLQLERAGVAGPTRRKLFSSFVEMAQNIIHYSSDALTLPSQDNGELRHGSVVDQLVRLDRLPVFVEGRVHTPEQAAEAMRRGAWAVVVGTAITHPTSITGWFAKAVGEAN